MSVCVWYACLYVSRSTCLCMYAEVRGGHHVPCSVVYHIPMRQGLSLILELGWQTINSSDPPVSPSGQIRDSRHGLPYPILHGFRDLNSGPHSCRTSAPIL